MVAGFHDFEYTMNLPGLFFGAVITFGCNRSSFNIRSVKNNFYISVFIIAALIIVTYIQKYPNTFIDKPKCS